MPQQPLNWDESKHPRDGIGEFASVDAAVPKQERGMHVEPPPRQALMFDDNPQPRLFDGTIFESTKKRKQPASPASGPSLVEQIEDELAKQHAANKKTLGGQREMFARRFERELLRYSKPKEDRGHWVTMHGAHIFIEDGKVTKGPHKLMIADAARGMKNLGYEFKTGKQTAPKQLAEYVFHKDGQDHTFNSDQVKEMLRDRWLQRSLETQRAMDACSKINIRFKEWVETEEPVKPPRGDSRKAAIAEAASNASHASGVPIEDILPLMPEAQKFLKQEQQEREKAKEHLRRVSGMNARSIATLENKYQDHSTVKNWDTTAREFAMNFPALGFDPDGHDTPALIWDFLREGKAAYISAFHPKVAELAALWAKPGRHHDDRLAGDEDGSHMHVEARSDDAVPFSRRRPLKTHGLAEKFSRLLQISRRPLLTSF